MNVQERSYFRRYVVVRWSFLFFALLTHQIEFSIECKVKFNATNKICLNNLKYGKHVKLFYVEKWFHGQIVTV